MDLCAGANPDPVQRSGSPIRATHTEDISYAPFGDQSMRIGIIDVANLVRVRKTYNPVWRMIITLLFLLFVCIWWAAIHQLRNLEDLNNIRIRTFVLAIVLLPTL